MLINNSCEIDLDTQSYKLDANLTLNLSVRNSIGESTQESEVELVNLPDAPIGTIIPVTCCVILLLFLIVISLRK